MPYIYASAVHSHHTGIPSMRAMVLEFPGDICCEDLDRQYMLGGSILVAPILNENGSAVFYLPEGEWTHFLSGAVKHGGKWLREQHDYFSLPLYVRENAIIPMGSNRSEPDYDYTDGLTLHVFALKDKAEASIYSADGALALKVVAVNEAGTITVTLDGEYRNLKICMRNIKTIGNACGAVCESSDDGVILSVTSSTVRFTL